MVKFTVGAKLADAVTRIEFAQFFTLKKLNIAWFLNLRILERSGHSIKCSKKTS